MSECSVTHSVTAKLYTKHLNVVILSKGDFDHMTKILPNFLQTIVCLIRDEKTLDLLYANVKDAYSSSFLPPLARSDQALVDLKPCFVHLNKQQPAASRTVGRMVRGDLCGAFMR